MIKKIQNFRFKQEIKKFLKKQSEIRFGVIILVVISFLIGIGLRTDGFSLWRLHRLYEKINYTVSDNNPLFSSFNGSENTKFIDVWNSIRYEYLNNQSTTSEASLIKGAYIGLINSLNDKYTYIEELKEKKDTHKNNGVIGVLLGYNPNNIVEIKSIEYNSPAYIAGLSIHDIFVKVDETNVIGKDIKNIKELISGPKNENVSILVYREKENKLIPKTLTRQESFDKTVTLEKLDNGIYHLTIHSFTDDLYQLFTEAISDEHKNIKKLIIDLRGNTGGDVGQAVQVISSFLNKDKIIFTQESRDKNIKEYKSTESKFPNLINIPKVILVNTLSASCSEIMSLALRDNQKVPIIGETTYGKGVITREIIISDDEILHLTTANWYGPKNESIQNIGIKPDIYTKKDSLKEGLKLLEK